mmetsp:Transcript_4251/g.13148  ORF Transcript_4251/g.13148 Transcript_4251/m.13148 type:complete len:206 (-) Transcript_4251:162-779(-)
MRSCTDVVGADASTVASRGSTSARAGAEPAARPGPARIVWPAPVNGCRLAVGGTYASVLLSMQCTSMSAPPDESSSSRGTCPRLMSARNCAFSGSAVRRSGPSSTVKPSRQKVIVCACPRAGCSPSAASFAAAVATGGAAALGGGAEARERPAPSASNGVPTCCRSALYSSSERAPSSSRARRMNSRGSRICWPEPPPFCPCPPA